MPPPNTTTVNYRLFLGIVISLFSIWAHWKQRMELLTLKESSSSALSLSSLSSPSVVPRTIQQQQHENDQHNNITPPQSDEESPMTQCTCPINPATPMTDDKYNDVKYLLDEMEQQESKWKIQLSDKTSQIETLKRDNVYIQRKFHDLEIKYEKDMLTYRDVMDQSATQCHAYVMDNAKLKRQVAELSVIRKVTGGTGTGTGTGTDKDKGTVIRKSDLLKLQEEEFIRQDKMKAMERKLHFLFIVLHVTHMDRNMCRMEVDDAEDDVMFLYSTLEQGTTKTTTLKKELNEIKSQKDELAKRFKTMVIGQQMYRVLQKKRKMKDGPNLCSY